MCFLLNMSCCHQDQVLKHRLKPLEPGYDTTEKKLKREFEVFGSIKKARIEALVLFSCVFISFSCVFPHDFSLRRAFFEWALMIHPFDLVFVLGAYGL